MRLPDTVNLIIAPNELQKLLDEASECTPKEVRESVMRTLRGDITRYFEELYIHARLVEKDEVYKKFTNAIDYIEKRLENEKV